MARNLGHESATVYGLLLITERRKKTKEVKKEGQKRTLIVLALVGLLSCLFVPSQLQAEDEIGQWINHLNFLAGSPDVTTQFNIVSVRGGGLEITAAAQGKYFVQQGLQVPPGYLINGVRVCYEQTGRSHINQVAILQLQDPPTDGIVAPLNDETTFNNSDPGPVCVNSALPLEPIDPGLGALSLRVGAIFANDTDSIVILGVGLLTVPDPNSPVSQFDKQLDKLTNAVIKHTHIYRTGKGRGHNNIDATTSTIYLGYEMPAPKVQLEDGLRQTINYFDKLLSINSGPELQLAWEVLPWLATGIVKPAGLGR